MNNGLIVFFGITFIFVMNVAGAALVFIFRDGVPPKVNTVFFGFASGVMVAASVWSLIIPAFNYTESYGKLSVLPVAAGFLLGGAFLVVLDKLIPKADKDEGTFKLFTAVTVHNIPEGLAVGFALGAAMVSKQNAAYTAALGLALGVGLQNLPEGAAVSLPMRSRLNSSKKAFLLGALSGAVEPVFAVLGMLFAAALSPLMPWMLSFAAGAMIFVVVEELIPSAKDDNTARLCAYAVMIGFVLMMILDMIL